MFDFVPFWNIEVSGERWIVLDRLPRIFFEILRSMDGGLREVLTLCSSAQLTLRRVALSLA